MHPRASILSAIRTALLSATSPSVPLFEQDYVANTVPCWQLAARTELPAYDGTTTRARLRRTLTIAITARGSTPSERDALSEALETALLDKSLGDSIELTLVGVELGLPEEGGQRNYPATYTVTALVYTTR